MQLQLCHSYSPLLFTSVGVSKKWQKITKLAQNYNYQCADCVVFPYVHPPTTARHALLSTDCWDVDVVPVMPSPPMIYPAFSPKRWNESGRPCPVQHVRRSVLHRLALRLPSSRHLSSDIVAPAIARLPDKSSAADPFPVSVLKGVSALLTPFLMYLFNRSLSTGCVPASFKDSFVTPILKKSGLDEASPSSYRPISNLSLFPRRWNAWLRVNLYHTSMPIVYCRQLNPASVEGIPPKLRLSGFSRIF